MRFAITIGDRYSRENLRISKQLGCTDVIGHGPLGPARDEVWEYGDLLRNKKWVEEFGLRLEVFEDGPTIEKIIWGLPDRDKQLDIFCKSLKHLAAAGIKVIKPQHMPPGFLKVMTTSPSKPTRGYAASRHFKYEIIKNAPLTEHGNVPEEQVWKNLEYFLKKALPYAEKYGVKIALHPDDPPISPIQGFPRILRSVEAFDRMLDIYPSDSIGLLFCQGCFAEMGVNVPDAIRHFGKRDKIFFSHFRNAKGSVHKPDGFQETFHDDSDGRVDMFEAMKAYYEVGFEGPMRPDHTPVMEGEEFGGPPPFRFFGRMGKILALGYMKGLAESVEKTGY